MATLILTGDVNLKGVTDAAVPLARVNGELRKADLVFSNLECLLCAPPPGHSLSNEGFFVDPEVGAKVLMDASIGVVGIANNVHYGEAINGSIMQLDRIGVLHTGAGKNLAAARAPAIVERAGVRFGFLQRSSVYWPTNHEARKDAVGIVVIKGHTAYQIPTSRLKPDSYPPNRPGLPPEIITWADAAYLAEFKEDIAALRPQVDVLVASCHWGLGHEVLQYMTEIAHGAIDAGADIVVGHGPHYCLPIEVYKGKPVFYSLCNLSFHSGHRGVHGDWIAMLVRIALERGKVAGVTFQFMRHNDMNETFFCPLKNEAEALADVVAGSASFATKLNPNGDRVEIALAR
jgi:poly-gamma-glutamate capsule biosynthesis protein CapA/YwtB (metallophosphatase superfamily)